MGSVPACWISAPSFSIAALAASLIAPAPDCPFLKRVCSGGLPHPDRSIIRRLPRRAPLFLRRGVAAPGANVAVRRARGDLKFAALPIVCGRPTGPRVARPEDRLLCRGPPAHGLSSVGIHDLGEPIVEVGPAWVLVEDQPYFPSASPMLHISLPLPCRAHVIVMFGKYELC